jgi:hypothetical protein
MVLITSKSSEEAYGSCYNEIFRDMKGKVISNKVVL